MTKMYTDAFPSNTTLENFEITTEFAYTNWILQAKHFIRIISSSR